MTLIEAINSARQRGLDIRREEWPLYKRIEAGHHGFWRWDDSTEAYTLEPDDVTSNDWELT